MSMPCVCQSLFRASASWPILFEIDDWEISISRRSSARNLCRRLPADKNFPMSSNFHFSSSQIFRYLIFFKCFLVSRIPEYRIISMPGKSTYLCNRSAEYFIRPHIQGDLKPDRIERRGTKIDENYWKWIMNVRYVTRLKPSFICRYDCHLQVVRFDWWF